VTRRRSPLRNPKTHRNSRFVTRDLLTVSCLPLDQPPSLRTTPCRPSPTAYSTYPQLPSKSDDQAREVRWEVTAARHRLRSASQNARPGLLRRPMQRHHMAHYVMISGAGWADRKCCLFVSTARPLHAATFMDAMLVLESVWDSTTNPLLIP